MTKTAVTRTLGASAFALALVLASPSFAGTDPSYPNYPNLKDGYMTGDVVSTGTNYWVDGNGHRPEGPDPLEGVWRFFNQVFSGVFGNTEQNAQKTGK